MLCAGFGGAVGALIGAALGKLVEPQRPRKDSPPGALPE
jgi:hypothetical protein